MSFVVIGQDTVWALGATREECIAEARHAGCQMDNEERIDKIHIGAIAAANKVRPIAQRLGWAAAYGESVRFEPDDAKALFGAMQDISRAVDMLHAVALAEERAAAEWQRQAEEARRLLVIDGQTCRDALDRVDALTAERDALREEVARLRHRAEVAEWHWAVLADDDADTDEEVEIGRGASQAEAAVVALEMTKP